jgi:hypothetical protein
MIYIYILYTLWIQPCLLRKYLGDDLGGELPSQSLCLDHFGSIGYIFKCLLYSYVVHLHKLGNGT